MKSFMKVAAVGVTGLVAFKVVTALALPLLGMLLAVIMLTIKVALFAAVAYFLYSLFCKRRDDVEVGEMADEVEVEIEVEN